MIDTKEIFNFTRVNQQEFDDFFNEGFLDNDKLKVAHIVYIIIFLLFNIFAIGSFVQFYKLRKSYIIRQRNFRLTFIGGIFAYLSVNLSLSTQVFKIPCSISILSANSLSVLVHSFFIVRSLSIILFYFLNLFKVSSINKRKRNAMKLDINQEIEPNKYILKVYRRISLINVVVLILPCIITTIATIVFYNTNTDLRENCSLTVPTDAMLQIKDKRINVIFNIIAVSGIAMMILNVINAITLCFIKDSTKYGIRFECICLSIMIIFFNFVSVVFRANTIDLAKKKEHEQPIRFLLNLYNVTKGGEMVFSFISFYIFLVFIPLPIKHYYKAKSLKNKNGQDPMSSLQFFYKVLNTPSLVNELRNIAVKEFSVENVLFWENYKILQDKTKNYQMYYNNEYPTLRPDNQYNFDYYYYQLQQRNYAPEFLNNDVYDPNMPIPRELFSYYISFYHMFIDYNGPSVVNLPERTVKNIVNEMCSYPTVGIYDQAAREVIEMMYTSLYPILLSQYKEYIMNTLM